MTIALVSAGAIATSLSPAFGAATGSGHLLIAGMFNNANSPTAPFSTLAPGWNFAVQYGTAFSWGAIAYKMGSAAGETAPVFTAAGAGGVALSMLAEFSGAATSGALDQSGNGGAAGGAIQVATCTAPDSQAGDLIVHCAGWNGGNAATVATAMHDGAGNAITPTGYFGTVAAGQYMSLMWGIAVAAGASGDTATATLSAFNNGTCGIASFAPAGSAPSLTQVSGATIGLGII